MSTLDQSPWYAPQSLIYHASSGNIVAILGLEAVVVGDTAENWISIEGHAVDVSLLNQIAFTIGGLWPESAMIAITVTAAVLALAKNGRTLITMSSEVGQNCSGLRFFVNYLLFRRVGPVLVLLVTPFWLAWASLTVSQDYEIGSFAFIATTASMLGAAAIWLKTRGVVGAWSLLLAGIASAVGLALIHTQGSSQGVADFTAFYLYLLTFWLGFIWGTMALISFLPSYVRHLHVVLAALLGIGGLIALAFTIGVIQGFYLGAAKLHAIVFITIAAWTFLQYLNSRIQKNDTER